jgi:hypothetical protein
MKASARRFAPRVGGKWTAATCFKKEKTLPAWKYKNPGTVSSACLSANQLPFQNRHDSVFNECTDFYTLNYWGKNEPSPK